MNPIENHMVLPVLPDEYDRLKKEKPELDWTQIKDEKDIRQELADLMAVPRRLLGKDPIP
jgi:hypothetical protein